MPKSPESEHDRTKGPTKAVIRQGVLDALIGDYNALNLDATNAKDPKDPKKSLRSMLAERYDERSPAPETPPEE